MRTNRGQSLFEVVVAVGVATIIIGSATVALVTSSRTSKTNSESQKGYAVAQEVLGTVRSYAEANWATFYGQSPSQLGSSPNFYLSEVTPTATSTSLSLNTGTTTVGLFENNATTTYTTWFVIENMYRGDGNVATTSPSGGVEDPSTLMVTASVTWPVAGGVKDVGLSQQISRVRSDVFKFSRWDANDYATTTGDIIISPDGGSVYISGQGGKSVKVLVVGGGGGGAAAGGGGGGYVYDDDYFLSTSAGSYSVAVGTGGTAGEGYSGSAVPTNGGNSVFNSEIVAYGGGFGGYNYGDVTIVNGGGGATGGGGPYDNAFNWLGGSATHGGQGYAGGANNQPYPHPSGGGGGAGEAGGMATAGVGGNGGVGVNNSISGSSVMYGAGGGGGVYLCGTAGTASSGGGAGNCNGSGGDGIDGRGGGGGGASAAGTGGPGGSGIVIIRYLTADFVYCSGGTKTTDGDYTVHTFLSDGTFRVFDEIPKTIEVLLVGGGGGGAAGGGGGGGFLYETGYGIILGEYVITVGTGGTAGEGYYGSVLPTNGGSSTFDGVTIFGGGFGGYNYLDTSFGTGSGATGGGGAYDGATIRPGGDSIYGDQGYDGGSNGTISSPYPSGGGGGSGGAGVDGIVGVGGSGGVGTNNAISGNTVMYGAGGGGAVWQPGFTGGTASSGGGVGASGGSGTAGINGQGGGGGGAGNESGADGGAGGSGVVIIRYLTSDFGTCTGGTKTTNGNYTIHTFTSDGTFSAS